VAEKIEFDLAVKSNDLNRALTDATAKTRVLEGAISSAVGFFGANIATKGIELLGRAFDSSIQSARQFGLEIAKINSTLPEGVRVTKGQERALLDLGDAYGKTGTEQAAGFFEIVSNGVEDSAAALDILKASNDAALAGITSLDSSAKVITTTLNAYASQGVTAAQVTDSLVVATQLSGVRFEELANSLGRVTGLASTSGVSIGELSGTIAFLNKNALTTEQAITGVRGILNAIIKPSEEATQIANRLGLSFNGAALESKGLVQFLREVSTATGNNSTTIARLFGDINAISSVVAIAKGGFDAYGDSVNKATNSQGAASKAANELKKSLDFTLDRQNAAVENLSISFAQALGPAITLTSEALTTFFQVAGSAFRPKAAETLSSELDKTNKIIEAIESKNYFDLQNLGIQRNVLTTAQLNKLLDDQIAKRDQLITKVNDEQKARLAGTAPLKTKGEESVVDNSTEQQINARRALNAELINLENQLVAERAAIAAAEDLSLIERNVFNEQEFLTLEFEQAQIRNQAIYEAELAKNALLEDARQQNLANQVSAKKLEAANEKAAQKLSSDAAKNQIALDRQLTQEKINNIQRVGSVTGQVTALASAIAKDGSKEQFAINQAGAIAQTLIARAAGIANALLLPPPAQPAAIAFANTTAGLSLATIAATSIKGFEEGGFVGGMNGASVGPDNRVAQIRDGEMVLNGQQQKTLMEMLNGGFSGGDIVVQIDGREVARAVRNQKQAGFVI
jgi:TP901 family phage tail tape measure protein